MVATRHMLALRIREEEMRMALQNHLSELERKHTAVDRELQEANSHPATDEARIAELKRRKLALKDELVRLREPERKTH